MEKEKVLVQDSKGLFLKMFKRIFKNEFDFFQDSLFVDSTDSSRNFGHFIIVLYDKYELLEYLRLDQKNPNVLVCLFDKKLYDSLFFYGVINNLILLNDSRIRKEIIKELKKYFKRELDYKQQVVGKENLNRTIYQTEFGDFLKTLFLAG